MHQLKTTNVRSRIDESLKNEATMVLQDCGLTVSSAIRLFLEQVVKVHGLPFEVQSKVPSAKTRVALQEAQEIEQRFSSIEEMLKDLQSRGKNG